MRENNHYSRSRYHGHAIACNISPWNDWGDRLTLTRGLDIVFLGVTQLN